MVLDIKSKLIKTVRIKHFVPLEVGKFMNTASYGLQLDKLCRSLHLGEMVVTPQSVSGGLLHRMYAVETTKGKFAIKALNSKIMERPTAMQNYINSEKIASIASKHIPAHPAKIFNGTCMQNIENQYYLIFDWMEGTSLKPDEITVDHCENMGFILADLHATDFSALGIENHYTNNANEINWAFYFDKGQENSSVWVDLFHENMNKLYDWNARAKKAILLLADRMVVSHRDLEPKNVIWHNETPMIIDWESAGTLNPFKDIVDSAIYWSKNGKGKIDKNRLLAFIFGYEKKYGNLQANWRMILEQFHGSIRLVGI